MNNVVTDTMLKRRSIRAYTPEKLTEDELVTLKKAALSAPTAMNRQDQRFLFITDTNTILEAETAVVDAIEANGDVEVAERIRSRGGKVMYDAPLLVIIFAKPARFAEVDSGIAVQNLALAAKSMGLESVILGMPKVAFDGEKGELLQKKLGVPAEFKFMIAISIGHPAMEKEPHEWDESHIIEIKG